MTDKLTKLFNKNFVLLWQGQFISKIGSQIYFIAIILWVKETTESASLLGMIGLIAGIPAVVFSVIGGTFADRHSRKKIIVFSDLLNGLVMLILALLFFFVKDYSLSIVVGFLLFTTVFTSIVSSYFSPAVSASIPDIVPAKGLAGANSWLQSTHQVVTITGMAIGGLLYSWLGAPLLILANAITFLFSGISELFIKIPQKIPEKKDTIKEKFKDFKNDTIEGYNYVWEKTGLKKLVLTSVLANFFSVPIALLLPFYIDISLQLGNDWLGYLLAISALGALIGFIIAGAVKVSPKSREVIILLCIFLDGVLYILLGSFTILWAVILILMLSGLFSSFVQVHIFTILQASTESVKRGRVFGFIGTISGALIPIAMGLAGFIADATNKNIPIIYIFSGAAVVFISFYLIMSKDIRSFLALDYVNTDEQLEEKKDVEEKKNSNE